MKIFMYRSMKLTFILVFAVIFFARADGMAQNVTLAVKTAKIERVFAEISQQTDLDFFYDVSILNHIPNISIRVIDESVDETLRKVFKRTPYHYKIINGTVLISSQPDERKPKTFELEEVHLQQGRISGIVLDQDNSPLMGATVSIVGKANSGVTTDAEGKFVIEVIEGETLIVSFIGYKSKEVIIENNESLSIQLDNLDQVLGEVIVVGYGQQLKREISGSVTNLSEEKFNKGVNRNAVDLLKGKVAGLTITAGSGDVASGETIRLRVTSSLTGNSAPFVVIDGVPGVNINSVAPQDIESISILKDASASAIYGSRSAGRVILITTKKG